jgi:spore germination protein
MKKNKILIILILILLLNSYFIFDCYLPKNFSLGYINAMSQVEPQTITVEEAQEITERRFSKYDIKKIEYIDKRTEDFNSYKFNLELENNQKFCAMVSARDGNLIKINCFDKKIPITENEEQCLEVMEQHINNLGFEDVEVVWSTKLEDQTIINLAPVQDSIVVYPDLIKARINCKTGEIIDLEARAYLDEDYPILDAEFLIPTFPIEDAKKELRDDFIVLSYRLALIFDDKGEERLVYEIRTEYQDFLYLIYIDAKTGEQVMAMPVVEE